MKNERSDSLEASPEAQSEEENRRRKKLVPARNTLPLVILELILSALLYLASAWSIMYLFGLLLKLVSPLPVTIVNGWIGVVSIVAVGPLYLLLRAVRRLRKEATGSNDS